MKKPLNSSISPHLHTQVQEFTHTDVKTPFLFRECSMPVLRLNKDKHTNGTFYTTATELGLLNIPVNQIKNNSDYVITQFPEVFSDQIGKVKYSSTSNINDNNKPVKQTRRRILFDMRKHVEQEVANLENQDVIEKVSGPTPCVSPVVPIPKTDPSEIRICIDMRKSNKAVERE